MKTIITNALICTFGTVFLTTAMPVLAETTPSCSLADINQALGEDLTCSTEGTVFFGKSVTQFVLNQCSTITNAGETDEGVVESRSACIRCARKAAIAFQAAKKAGLLPSSSNSNLSIDKIKQLCRISDDGEDDGDTQPPVSDALASLYNQLRLCFPQVGQSVDATQCTQCATVLLDDALKAGVINQAKYTVVKKSIQQVCSRHGGDEGNGDNGQPTPTPTPGDGQGSNTFEQYYAGLRSCFEQYHSPTSFNPEACVSCVNGLSTEGLDPTKLNTVLPYALNACQRTFDAK